MIRRTTALIGLIFAALLVLAPAASAQYVDDGGIVPDPTNPSVGDDVLVNGTGCQPSDTVQITMSQGGQTVVVGTATANAQGAYTTNVAVPDSFTNGTATITDSCGNTATITIGSVAGTALPRTGSETGTLWRVAVALVAVGGVLVLTTRKRAEAKVDA